MLEPEENKSIFSESISSLPEESNLHKDISTQKGQELLKSFENTVAQVSGPESVFENFTQALAPNEIIADKYKIIEVASSGSMGLVYKAQDLTLNRTVAIKVLLPDKPLDPVSKKRFEREAIVVASLNHPNIVTLYESGVLKNGMLYLVMEYIEGQTLADLIQNEHRLDFHVAPTHIYASMCST